MLTIVKYHTTKDAVNVNLERELINGLYPSFCVELNG